MYAVINCDNLEDKIWLSSPHMGGKEFDFVKSAFDENWIAPLGPNVTGFEQDLEDFLKENCHVAALSSGTAALHLALILLGVQNGDEVICQSMTFSASANPIAYLGATPVFVDSESETWNICPVALEDAVVDRIAKGKKPKAIIVVHLYGMPAKMDEILAISNKYEIPIIEDSAEALGSTYKGKSCGTFGAIGVLSFNGNKIITTSGGGALVAHQKEQKDKAIFLATQARDAAVHYQHSEIGYNYRLSNISAGIGRGQMLVLNDRVKARRAMNVFYANFFNEVAGVTVFQEPDHSFFSNHWLSAATFDSKLAKVDKEKVYEAFHKNNIECRPLWKPMHLQPVFKNAPYYGGTVAENLFSSGLCLPSGSNLSSEELLRIENVLKELFK